MDPVIVEKIYGQGPLADAYFYIDKLSECSKSMQRVIDQTEVFNGRYSLDAFAYEYKFLKDYRTETMDAVEDCLLEASESVEENRSSYDATSVFLGYTAYLGAVHPALSTPAKLIALKGLSLRQNVPIISDSYTNPQAGVVLSRSPLFDLHYANHDSHKLNMHDDTEIFFEGVVDVIRSDTTQCCLKVGKHEMINLIVGSKAVSLFLKSLDNIYKNELSSSLSRDFACLYKPNESALDDNLNGVLDLNLN
jgi:hypothetical protein